MFGTDPDQVERRVSQWAGQFADRAERFESMRVQVEQISVTESSADGAVRVTVDSTGSPTDLMLSDKIRGMAPPEVAAQVMVCLRRAQGRLAGRVREAMAATVGDEEQVVEHVVAGYEARFPDQHQETPAPGPGVVTLGAIEEDARPSRPAPSQRRRRPRPPDGDDDDFGDQSYLR